MRPGLPHKKIHILTTYIIALTAREATLSSDSSSLGATDLIASGDWTVPREGRVISSLSALSFEQMMLAPISASGLVGLLFQSPFFFHVALLLLWALITRLGTSGV